MLQTKVVDKIKTRILCSMIFFFSFENRVVYGIMWKNMVQPERPHGNMAHAHLMLDT